jgi:hypothetical protein
MPALRALAESSIEYLQRRDHVLEPRAYHQGQKSGLINAALYIVSFTIVACSVLFVAWCQSRRKWKRGMKELKGETT